MDKHRRSNLHEESPSITGPDYVALVIEWDDIADSMETAPTARGTAGAQRAAMGTSEKDRDWNSVVDEAGMESFPASDPPAWGSSHAVASPDVPEDLSDEVTAPFEAKPVTSLRRVMLGFAAIAALISMVEGLRRLRHA